MDGALDYVVQSQLQPPGRPDRDRGLTVCLPLRYLVLADAADRCRLIATGDRRRSEHSTPRHGQCWPPARRQTEQQCMTDERTHSRGTIIDSHITLIADIQCNPTVTNVNQHAPSQDQDHAGLYRHYFAVKDRDRN